MLKQLKVLLVLVYLLSSAAISADESDQSDVLGNFVAEINRAMQARVCREGKVGVLISDLKTGDSLYQHNPDLPLTPASNQKILTTIAALGMMTPQYQFKTSVYHDGEIKNGVLEGNIYLKGGGDPFLVKEQLWKLADSVYNEGIRQIKGNVVTDKSFFDDIGLPSRDWSRIKMPLWYNAPTGGLAFNFNAISVIATPGKRQGDPVTIEIDPPLDCFEIQGNPKTGRKGSRISLILDIKEKENKIVLLLKGKMPQGCATQKYFRHVDHADLYAGFAFKYFLEQAGITISGSVEEGTVQNDFHSVTVQESEPLFDLLQAANKFSNNFMIEQTVKTIAAEKVSLPGTTMKGLNAIRKYFSEDLSIDCEGMILDDGSGLSRKNRVTARQFVELIRYTVNESTFGPEFLSGLPIAGIDGTLKKRLKKHSDNRLIRAKTGLIDNVVCLSGVIDGRKGEGIVFSILMNKNRCRHRDSKKVQDKMLESMLNYWVERNQVNESATPDQ